MQTVPSNFEPAPDWGRIEDIQRRVVHVGRSVIYQWINDGLIESVAVRKRSAKTGCRLRSDRKSSCLGEKRAQSGSKSRGGAFGARCGSERLRFQFRRCRIGIPLRPRTRSPESPPGEQPRRRDGEARQAGRSGSGFRLPNSIWKAINSPTFPFMAESTKLFIRILRSTTPLAPTTL
jgi:hypothetical protein